MVFDSIYKSNHWNKSKQFDKKNQSFSGPGSIPNSNQTNNLIFELEKFFKKNNVKKILDAPCGDCAWIEKIFKSDINYVGIDIVKELIIKNSIRFNSYQNIKFYCEDLTEYNEFNHYDFILLRDFFIHLPLENIKKILNNLKVSNCKFFAFNNYESIKKNKEILMGQHRKINILIEPFNFKKPDFKIHEIKNDDLSNLKSSDNFIYIYKNYIKS